MATPASKAESTTPPAKPPREKIRYRIFFVVALLLTIALLFTFLLNYSGFDNWKNIDSNLAIFATAIVNIVLLTVVFYMVLRNLFKLVYERRKPFAGVGLKTKLIIAFVALSLPSTAFHLMASGFMAFLLETWSQGEQKQVLESAQVVMGALADREDKLLRGRVNAITAYLPSRLEDYKETDWLNGMLLPHKGGVVVYDQENKPIVQWATSKEELAIWHAPPAEYFAKQEDFNWMEIHQERTVRRMLISLPGSPDRLKAEVFEVTPEYLSSAQIMLNRKELNNRFISRDLFFLVVSSLIVITLLIILAATWVSFYLARGFVTPVEKLAAGTRRVREGELGYQVDGSSLGPLEGDFEELVRAFNLMSTQLKEQRNQLVQTTEDLRSSHHELGERNWLVELLLENIDAGILSLNPQGAITAMNRAAVKLVQPRSDAWMGRHYRAVLGRELVELLDQMLVRLRSQGGRQVSQNLTISQNRKPVHIEINVLALESKDGKSEGVVAVLKDATTEQRRQRALAWREVARRVAHEIKNPLTPIQLSAQRIRRNYLKKGASGNGAESGKILDQCTQTIIKEVSSLKKMVNEFSDFAKLPESVPRPDDLNEVIEEVAQLYRNGLPENIRIELDLGKKIPKLPLDREQMKRVFTNLIDNAVASLAESNDGVITINSAHNRKTDIISVEVMDDGIGVPEEIQGRLFEPYATTKEEGTGLGLSIVNQIISDHQGFIRYSDRKPSGSIFSIEFKSSWLQEPERGMPGAFTTDHK